MMEQTHFYFAMVVSLVLLTLGWAVATASPVGYSLMGLGSALAALALVNRFMASEESDEPAHIPAKVEVAGQRPLEQ